MKLLDDARKSHEEQVKKTAEEKEHILKLSRACS